LTFETARKFLKIKRSQLEGINPITQLYLKGIVIFG